MVQFDERVCHRLMILVGQSSADRDSLPGQASLAGRLGAGGEQQRKSEDRDESFHTRSHFARGVVMTFRKAGPSAPLLSGRDDIFMFCSQMLTRDQLCHPDRVS